MMPDKNYPSDLAEEEWKVAEKCLHREDEIKVGRPLNAALRRVRDAILHISKTGCQWAYLPHDFPTPTTVNYHDIKCMTTGVFERANSASPPGVAKKRSDRKTERRDHRQPK